jgi:hypothetical protein
MGWINDIGTVRSIQMEYIRHVRSFYGTTMDKFKASGISIEDFANEWMRQLLDVNDLVTRYKGSYMPQGISRALEFLVTNREFWAANSPSLSAALRKLKLFGLGVNREVPCHAIAPKQLLYFDCILIPDPAFVEDELQDLAVAPFQTLIRIVIQVLYVAKFEEATSANTECPLVIFYPEEFGKSLLQSDPSIDLVSRYSEEVFGVAVSREQLESRDWPRAKRIKVKLRAAERKKAITETLLTAPNDLALLQLGIPKGIYDRAVFGEIKGTDLRYILAIVAGEMNQISRNEIHADKFCFDSLQNEHWSFLSSTRERYYEKEWAKHIPLQESELASYAFRTGFKWLDPISLSDSIKLREADVNQEMRNGLRASRAALRSASLEEFPEAAKRFESQVKEFVSGFSESSKKMLADSRRKLGMSYLSLIGSGSLAVAAAAFPAIMPLAVISTIASVALGGKSMRDIVNAHLDGRHMRKELQQRPIAFLADLLGKDSPRGAILD